MFVPCFFQRVWSPRCWWTVIAVLTLGLVLLFYSQEQLKAQHKALSSSSFGPVVPDTFHFVHLDEGNAFPFVSFLCVLAAWINHDPKEIHLHSNVLTNLTLVPRVQTLQRILGQTLVLRPAQKPTHVFGSAISSVFHAADVLKIQIAIEEGGVFLDGDTFIVRSLREFYNYQVTIGWPTGQNIGSQLVICAPRAEFTRLWLRSYKDYRAALWYYNAGELPTKEILSRRPELVHRVNETFGVHNLADKLYKTDNWKDWKSFHAIHLLFRHRDYLAEEDVEQSGILNFDEENIWGYNRTFGVMARQVLTRAGFKKKNN